MYFIRINCISSDLEHVNFKVELFVKLVILNDGLFSCIILTISVFTAYRYFYLSNFMSVYICIFVYMRASWKISALLNV